MNNAETTLETPGKHKSFLVPVLALVGTLILAILAISFSFQGIQRDGTGRHPTTISFFPGNIGDIFPEDAAVTGTGRLAPVKILPATTATSIAVVGGHPFSLINFDKALEMMQNKGYRPMTLAEIIALVFSGALLENFSVSTETCFVAAGSITSVSTPNGQQHRVIPVVCLRDGQMTVIVTGAGIVGLLNPNRTFFPSIETN